jgi:DNA ligase-associated metallophosphoesterase
MSETVTEPRDLAIEVAHEELTLMAERALYWARASTLLVADAHFGKAATFRAGGIYVPRGTTASALARLESAVARTGATRLILLGDLLHAREGRSPETLGLLAEWRSARPAMDVFLVRGNHDRAAGDPPESLGIDCVDAPLLDGPFAFAHHPKPMADRYVIGGHIHPAVILRGCGRQYERLPCFWMRPSLMVLPAFGDFTGLGDVESDEGDRIFVLANASIIEVAVAE